MRKRQWHVRERLHDFSVEASHANASARAIAFFSYIWFKQHFVTALLQAAQCSGYHAQLPTLRTRVRFAVG